MAWLYQDEFETVGPDPANWKLNGDWSWYPGSGPDGACVIQLSEDSTLAVARYRTPLPACGIEVGCRVVPTAANGENGDHYPSAGGVIVGSDEAMSDYVIVGLYGDYPEDEEIYLYVERGGERLATSARITWRPGIFDVGARLNADGTVQARCNPGNGQYRILDVDCGPLAGPYCGMFSRGYIQFRPPFDNLGCYEGAGIYWWRVADLRHTLTVHNGTGGGRYAVDENVPIKADFKPGKRFVRWDGDADRIGDTKSSSTTFLMPDWDAEVSAIFRGGIHVFPVIKPDGVVVPAADFKELPEGLEMNEYGVLTNDGIHLVRALPDGGALVGIMNGEGGFGQAFGCAFGTGGAA